MQKDFFTSQNSKLFCNTGLHFVLTNRYHGVSNTPYNSLNLAYHVGDNLESVKKNRAYIMQKYYENKTLLYLNQIHSNTIFTIRENRGILESTPLWVGAGFGVHFNKKLDSVTKYHVEQSKVSNIESKKDISCLRTQYDKILESSRHSLNETTKKHENTLLPNQCDEILIGDGDGLICDSPRVVLMSMVADCNPILVYAKSQNVFAVLHAGRLGVCSKILTHALLLFMRDYGVKTQDICIFIGASIRKCCYEIDKNLALQLIQEFGEKYVVCEDNRYKFDMIGLLCDEIESFGISLSQVEIYPSCSCCDESYFSYRRENVTGRFALFASLFE